MPSKLGFFELAPRRGGPTLAYIGTGRDDDGPHKFVRPTLATKGSCLALTQLRIARNETKRFPGSGDG